MSSKKSWRECIRHFTPAWYVVIMGTGVTSSLVHHFPYARGSFVTVIFELIIFFINLILFTLVTGATIARYTMFPDLWGKMLRHPAQSLFLGAFPMGFATLINVGSDMNLTYGVGGMRFVYFLWVLWWFDALVSFLCAFGMVHAMSNIQTQTFSKMAAVWLLPIVTLIVASSTGGLLGANLKPYSTTHALISTCVSLLMVIIGLSLALMMITVYLARLIVYGPPDANLILSAFIVLGPLGQGGYSLLVNGGNLAQLLPVHNTGQFPMSSVTGELIYSFCFCAAYALWSMGICWASIAVLSTIAVVRESGGPKFSLAYWGLIFPNGVYSLLAIQLGNVTDNGFLKGFAAFWTCITYTLWFSMMVRSIPALADRSIFNAPCLAAFPAQTPNTDAEADKVIDITCTQGSVRCETETETEEEYSKEEYPIKVVLDQAPNIHWLDTRSNRSDWP